MPFDMEHERDGDGDDNHHDSVQKGIMSGFATLQLVEELFDDSAEDACSVCFSNGYVVGALLALLDMKDSCKPAKDGSILSDEELFEDILMVARRLRKDRADETGND